MNKIYFLICSKEISKKNTYNIFIYIDILELSYLNIYFLVLFCIRFKQNIDKLKLVRKAQSHQ